MSLRSISFLSRCSFFLAFLFVLLVSSAGAAFFDDKDKEMRRRKEEEIRNKIESLSFCLIFPLSKRVAGIPVVLNYNKEFFIQNYKENYESIERLTSFCESHYMSSYFEKLIRQSDDYFEIMQLFINNCSVTTTHDIDMLYACEVNRYDTGNGSYLYSLASASRFCDHVDENSQCYREWYRECSEAWYKWSGWLGVLSKMIHYSEIYQDDSSDFFKKCQDRLNSGTEYNASTQEFPVVDEYLNKICGERNLGKSYKEAYCDMSSVITCISDAVSVFSTKFPLSRLPFIGNVILINNFIGAANTFATYQFCGKQINISYEAGWGSIFSSFFKFQTNLADAVSANECVFNLLGW
ncbi:MAG: hypothetical protein CDV28_10871 [Candidatus Electronema aureum]|uniref:Uncharacterized protein n=1 Tax=Candidatus Electronema aureum TaxID=2005002 RepID=A0A521G2S7_9BACT|nr:MAG: hypothetical protein CDV28_10871 [Candidatus Electronema aureum]